MNLRLRSTISCLRHYLVLGLIIFGAGVAAADPQGLERYRKLELLPQLTPAEWCLGASSWDRTGGNNDRGNFLYQSGSEYVMAELSGQGALYRLWVTGQNGGAFLRVYLDGATTPQINSTFNNVFAGNVAPFLTPLAGNNVDSSGGFYLYLPVTFTNACRVTTTDSNPYYNLGFVTAPTATSLVTWTGAENSSDVRTQWTNASAPVGTYANTRAITSSFALAPGAAVTIAGISGPRCISSIQLVTPSLGQPNNDPLVVTDDGRAHKGYSRFIMAVQSNASGATLVRRMDYAIANQKANVSIDGANAGVWFDSNSYGSCFYDSRFQIASNLVGGKQAVTVQVSFVSSQIDWNEFTYWMYSRTGTVDVLKDTLDVGTSTAALASEAAHHYSISNQFWEGTRTYAYLDLTTPENYVLSGVWMRASWDGLQNAVAAPLGFFFGMPFGVREMHGLMLGVLTNAARAYNYFPMPFTSSATIVLTNAGNAWASNLWCEVRHSDLPAALANFGHLFATYTNKNVIGGDGQDYMFLDVTGCGHLVGVVHAMKGAGSSRVYLEGDERFYVDNCRSPVIYGTGTEDYYNGGWYFDRGPFSRPVHGNQNHVQPGGNDWTACYRLHLADRIPFRTRLRAGIEHGHANDTSANYASLAFWYGTPDPAMQLIDSVDVGNAASEAAHSYTNYGASTLYSLTAGYPGNFAATLITDTGRVHTATSSFMVSVSSGAGLVLQRRADAALTNQRAEVYCNGNFCGTWLLPGYTPASTRWYDDTFFIPPQALPPGATQVLIALTPGSGQPWSEFRYDVYALPLGVPEGGLLPLCLLVGWLAQRRQ